MLNSSTHDKPALSKMFVCTRGVIFLGTPFNGTDLASWLQSAHDRIGLSKKWNLANVYQLRKNSDQTFDRITDQWKSIIHKPRGRLPPIDATYFYEESSPDNNRVSHQLKVLFCHYLSLEIVHAKRPSHSTRLSFDWNSL